MISDILGSKKSCFETGVQSVLRGQENRLRLAVLHQGILTTNQRSEENGVCAIVYKNGVKGFSSMAEFSEEAAEKVIKAATENANYLRKYASSEKVALPPINSQLINSKRFIIDFEQKRIIDLLKQVDDYVVAHCPKITSRTVNYREDTMEKYIYTSDACDGHVAYPRCRIAVCLKMPAKDGSTVELFELVGGFGNIEDHFKSLDKVYEKVDHIYKALCDKAEGVYAEAGYKTVILDPRVAGMIAHEAIGHTVEADLVMGGSVAGPNLGKKVASDKISIVDYAYTYQDGQTPLPVYIDDEGVPAEDAVLVDKGVLTGFMHNRETALKYGVKPQGNARGYAFSDEPLIRMRNTTVLPGQDKLEDMIASVEDGYYLIDTGNGQADLTGEFMFGITAGYEIKKGKLGRAILDTTVSGIAFDMLNTVDMVSDEVSWSPFGTCGKKQPMAVSMGGPAIKCKINIGGR
ncbi:TldD/PmbA family protein [Pseudobutyrivibrio xylanivorans]|uniref:TldD/PmbA family protein n=1 Tax=Pseudobutyrivibrio xylanivorans TaxID=185007 RepID=A0A5P6VRD9_PSEXY|nr:TldD/PmbA family protein [Pseudobutyrivibrio xylanivorans]QFJ55186.1 TldD/PmbA family protein [Pseudobutyrivibrio xylanivorans]